MKHLAIILDGNRTWAREQGKPEFMGHTQGAKNIQTIVKAVISHGIEVLSMYVLSTENLKNRSDSELKHLFSLFEKLIDYKNLFQENKISVHYPSWSLQGWRFFLSIDILLVYPAFR